MANERRREFDPTNRGKLEKNADRRDERDRDYKGSINIDGREYWLSGYVKRSEYGTFLSLRAKPKDEERRASYQQDNGRRDEPAAHDEIEF